MWQCLFWTIVLSYLVESRGRLLPPSDRSGENFFADILREVLQTSAANDVLLVLRNSLLNGQTSDVLDKIVAATTRRVPALYVNADCIESKFQNSILSMSRELIVYVYISERGPSVVEGELVAGDTRCFVHNRIRPKVLVLMVLYQPCHNLTAFFRAMWSKKILDAIVVEYLKPGHPDKHPATVHRYDPFTDSHTEEPYSSASTTWFADDFPNMQGYPLVYAFPRRPPYIDFITTPRGYESKGLDKILADILADKMNFTGVAEIITNPTYVQKTLNGTQYGLMMDVTFGKYDAILTTLPISGKVPGIQHIVQDTYPLLLENWCFAVPKLFAKQDFAIGTAIQLLFINFSIIGIFWVCSRIMKFDSDTWNCLRIIGMILAASFPTTPRKLHERVIFLSVLAVSVSYSSMLFVELTSIGFERNYMQFDRVEDLLMSDLVPVIHKDIWNLMKMFNNDFKNLVDKSGKKILNIPGPEICLEEMIMYQNVSCFVYEDWAKLTAVKNMRNGKTMMKTTKLCYWSPLAVKVFSSGSPYVKRVNDLLLMLWSGGIRDKWYREYLRNETKATAFETHGDQSDIPRVSVFYPIIYVLTTGYLVSVVVLIGELIWKYFVINLNLPLF